MNILLKLKLVFSHLLKYKTLVNEKYEKWNWEVVILTIVNFFLAYSLLFLLILSTIPF